MLVGNIFTMCAILITNGTSDRDIAANDENVNTIGANGANTNQWYNWENPEHTYHTAARSDD